MPKAPNSQAGPSNGGNGKARPLKVIQKTGEMLEKGKMGKAKGKEREVFGDLNRLIGGAFDGSLRNIAIDARDEGSARCNHGGEVCKGIPQTRQF